MSTTINGSLKNLDTKDNCEYVRKSRKYNYDVTASGGGTVRLKIEYYSPGQIGTDVDSIKGRWVTLVKRFKTDSGQTTSGNFTLPGNADESRKVKFIFSRGVGTKGVDYKFFMKPA